MVLTKDELIGRLDHEVHILEHLLAKVKPSDCDYRPTPGQRSLRELLEYLAIFVPIHVRAIAAGHWDREKWGEEWRAEKAMARTWSLEDIEEAIAAQTSIFADLRESLTDEDLRFEMEMFGRKTSRGEWLVWMVLSHYAAYRMQLFLYLKACGREELGTLDLWAGVDSPVHAAV